MITGELRSQVDRIWDAFWSGGIADPLRVIEQFTYLIFIKRLDDLHTLRERRANRLRQPLTDGLFPSARQELRWSHFKNFPPEQMFTTIRDKVFPYIKEMGGKAEDSAYGRHMADAVFIIPSPGLLAKVVEMIDKLPLSDNYEEDADDTKGDLYEYMLGKLANAGQAGQFRTPRHIIRMMVQMVKPRPEDLICDPAEGTAGFLMTAAHYLRRHYPEIFHSQESARHFNTRQFTGFDFDATMLRIGSMNMLLHGVENPRIERRDSLSEDYAGEREAYTLVLANPPFAGAIDHDSCARNLQSVVKTRKTELLFVALFLRLLKPGGRAAVIVPDGVLFGSSKAHKDLRRLLVEGQKLDGVVSMPSGVFKPYAGVSTAVLLFTRTDSGGTDNVWFYDMQADGFSLNDKRTPLDATKHENNNLSDIVARWDSRAAESGRARTDQSFLVPKAEIAANGYDLSINRYKEVVHDATDHEHPHAILADLRRLEEEIMGGMRELEGMLR